jgi:hypothetical protein
MSAWLRAYCKSVFDDFSPNLEPLEGISMASSTNQIATMMLLHCEL